MNPRRRLVLAIGVVGLTGCFHDEWSVEKALLSRSGKIPETPQVSPGSMETAGRVEGLGRQILTQNTFTGLDPLFHTVGVKEPVLFHRGHGELFISEGLVSRCKSDAELAAILCSELGRMKAERHGARRAGRDTDPFPEVGKDAPPAAKPQPQIDPTTAAPDAQTFARELMTGSGFDPAELDRVEPLLKEAAKNDSLRKQMAGAAAAPQWRK